MKKIYLIIGLLGLHTFSQAATININDASLVGGQTYNWTKDNVYVLDGAVYLEEGGILNIEAGTVVKFTPKSEVGNPSALIITRGAKINATGTKENPIIFTAQADDLADPMDLGPSDNSLWGGLAILGKGITQKNGNPTTNLEGVPTTDPRGSYGGTDNADNSGVLRYVSIRHGGREIVSGSELNGLSLAGVGSGTTLEYIEIYANSDDGIEFFGGAPNVKYAVVAFVEDDCFDWDEVYTGKGQFWFSIQRSDVADAGGELDGSTPDDLTPYSNPTVFNWTHIGSGIGATAGNSIGWVFRAGTAGIVANSIVTEQKGKVIEVQDKTTGANDALAKLKSGELKLMNNIFFGNGSNTAMDASTTGVIKVTGGSQTPDEPTATTLVSHLSTNKNVLTDPMIMGIDRTQTKKLDPRPSLTGSAYMTEVAAVPTDGFFTPVTYKGAFSALGADFWLAGWSALDRNDHLVANIMSNEEAAGVNTISLFPNPAKSEFTLSLSANDAMNLSLINSNGMLVKTLPSTLAADQQIKVDVQDLASGIYLLKIANSKTGKFFTKKLVIE